MFENLEKFNRWFGVKRADVDVVFDVNKIKRGIDTLEGLRIEYNRVNKQEFDVIPLQVGFRSSFLSRVSPVKTFRMLLLKNRISGCLLFSKGFVWVMESGCGWV